MAFCSSCGQQLAPGAKFCANCGAASGGAGGGGSLTGINSSRNHEAYAGGILKCPSCGEVIPSMTAICPSCGHELNATQKSESLAEFIDDLADCDSDIRDNPRPPSGWKTWNKKQKRNWVWLNIFTACIPLSIQMIIPVLKYHSTPELSPEEQAKVDLIQNFSFDNTRAAYSEGMYFLRDKVSYIAREKVDRYTAYWARLWTEKATSMFEKSQELMPNDKKLKETYLKVVAANDSIKAQLRKRLILSLTAFVAYIVFLLVFSHFSEQKRIEEERAAAAAAKDVPAEVEAAETTAADPVKEVKTSAKAAVEEVKTTATEAAKSATSTAKKKVVRKVVRKKKAATTDGSTTDATTTTTK